MVAPKLRFKEFNSDWNSVSLLDISTLITKGTTPKQFINGDINFLKIEAITQSGFDLSKCQTINSEIHNKVLKRSILKEGDILFAIAGATIGKNAIVKKELLPANTNQALAIIRLKENYSKVFISKVLNSPLMEKYIDINISTGAQPNLNLQQIGNFPFALPKLEEQTKIATFLSAVDEKIAQLSQKRHLLGQYKQGMMQQLFSQQIRFKADDGSEFAEWEEKRLGDVCRFINGRAYKQTEWEKEGTPVIRLQNLTGSGKEYYYSTLNLPDHQYCHNNDLLYMWSATFGPVFWQGEKAIFHYHIWKIEVKPQQLDKKYMYYLLDEMTKKMKSSLNGSTMLHVTKQGMEGTKKNLPSIEEQTKIANFLSTIDQKIDVVSEQLKQAKIWKKGLLQQMFV